MEAEFSHPLLLSQLREHYGEKPDLDPATKRLLGQVQQTYREGDARRGRLQRTLASSIERLLAAFSLAAEGNRSGTVLCVCKESGIGRLIERVLSNRGYRVLKASGPSGAREQAVAHSGEIDLVILDALFPDTTGLLLLDRLQAHLRGPAILLTDRKLPAEGRGPGYPALLRKPFTVGELGELVEATLGPLQESLLWRGGGRASRTESGDGRKATMIKDITTAGTKRSRKELS